MCLVTVSFYKRPFYLVAGTMIIIFSNIFINSVLMHLLTKSKKLPKRAMKAYLHFRSEAPLIICSGGSQNYPLYVYSILMLSRTSRGVH